jgi:hypothetical protein
MEAVLMWLAACGVNTYPVRLRYNWLGTIIADLRLLLRPQVVCEEAEDAGWSKRTGRNKSRFIAGVVTPAKPHYLYGMVEAEGDTQFGSSSSLPVVGEWQAGSSCSSAPDALLRSA